jgi:hypothetical protein
VYVRAEHLAQGGSPSANAFGGQGQSADKMPPLKMDADHDILTAMERWVESKVPPGARARSRYAERAR